jgi:segregation and condensation protein A
MPMLQLGTYEGPLDLLLELARAQRVDFAAIPMLELAGQFVAAVEAAIAGGKMPLGQVGDWLVAAATLMALRARLLLPVDAPERRDADREAAALRHLLAEREAVRRLADWLEARPQLGRDVFGRGMSDDRGGRPAAGRHHRAAARLPAAAGAAASGTAVYRPAPPPLWRVPAALAHLPCGCSPRCRRRGWRFGAAGALARR